MTSRKAGLPPECPVQLDVDDAQLLAQVVSYYHQRLKENPSAQSYLVKRGMVSSELVEHFKIGFSDRTLGLKLPENNRKAGKEIRSRLAKLGILRESGHELFAGSITFPVFDLNGQVVQLYGRKTTPNLRPGTPLHLFLPGPRGLWNAKALAVAKTVILTDSVVNALTLWCSEQRNVIALLGDFTEEDVGAFKVSGTEKVLIATRNTEPSNKIASEVAQQLTNIGIAVERIQLPAGMDINDYALSHPPAIESLSRLMGVAAVGIDLPAREPAPMRPGPPPPLVPVAARPEAAAGTIFEKRGLDVISNELVIELGDRRYRVRGLDRNLSSAILKVNLLVSRPGLSGTTYYVDSLDLYAAKQRAAFIGPAAVELGVSEDVIKRDLGQVLLQLEEAQEALMRDALTPKVNTVTLSEQDTAEALALLKEPRLLDRILADFEKCGVVGEETNKLVGYLAVVSRKLDQPLAVVIQSSSAAGKSSLMDAVLAFVPPEEQLKYSAMTGQSLYYLGGNDLRHKVLAIVEDEGAERISYALKLLQSEGELTIASTGKDGSTGRLVTQEYRVQGPVMLFFTTTAVQVDEELLNRCLVLTVDEERPQTQAIHRLQREKQTLEGLLGRTDKDTTLKLHHNAQRLLRPLLVANPFARQLTFLDDRTRTRRDFPKYLNLIRTIALLHQHQREVKRLTHEGREVEFIEVVPEDIAIANRLADLVLGRSLDDAPPHTRWLLMLIDVMATAAEKAQSIQRVDYRFTRKQVREHTGWGNTQLKVHLRRLVELEHLLLHRGGRGQSYVYELVYDGRVKGNSMFLSGLIDSAALKYDGQWAGSGRPSDGPWPVGGRDPEGEATARADKGNGATESASPGKAHLEPQPESSVAVAPAAISTNGVELP